MNKNFIKATKEFCTFDNYVSAPLFRKKFSLDFLPQNAEISICGLGFYRLFINGTDITKGHIAPYISNPDDYCYYDTYRIEDFLEKGENVIGVMLGNGFYNCLGGSIWYFEKNDWRQSPVLALEFSAKDGDKTIEFIADTDFKVHSSPIYFDDLRMGEYYDSNLELDGWNKPGFDDSEWENALTADIPRGEMKLCKADPIKVIREIKPVKITECKNGYIYDFGVNTAGICRFAFNGDKGQKITVRYSEMLTEDGELSRDSINFIDNPLAPYYEDYHQKDIYISDGTNKEYIPNFTYHGFRYAEVSGIRKEQATEDALTYLEMSSDLRSLAKFNCSDETVNTLYEMVVRSDRSNFYYFPTDCPHREKNGWTGDASVSAERMVQLYDVSASWHEWLNNIRKAQKDSGELPGIVPTAGWGFEWGNGPAWDSVIFNLPYMLYKYRGDLEAIHENAKAMMRYLEYIIEKRNPNGTVSIGLGDWVPVNRDHSDYLVPLEVTDSVMVIDMAKKAAEMFDAVGYKHRAKFAYGIYEDMRRCIRENLIDTKTGTVVGESQSGQAICLYYGVFEKSEEANAVERLLEYIHKNNDSFDCGFLGLRTIFDVLSNFGYGELAYHMITKKGFPSYADLIEQGETSIPEQFVTPENATFPSHNHHFLGDVGKWFIHRIAGICPVDKNHVEIKPDFIKSIDYASAELELPDGTVSVDWKRENGIIKLNISVCDGVEYNIVLPKKFNEKIIINGELN